MYDEKGWQVMEKQVAFTIGINQMNTVVTSLPLVCIILCLASRIKGFKRQDL